MRAFAKEHCNVLGGQLKISPGGIRKAVREALQKPVVPAKTGIQDLKNLGKSTLDWMPACAGMTADGLLQRALSIIEPAKKCFNFAVARAA